MRAKFYASDGKNGRIANIGISDFEIKEDGISRPVTSVKCAENIKPKALSSVLVIDVSGSMAYGSGGAPNLKLAETAARSWVNALPLGRSECAIVSFDDQNYFNQDYTTNRSKLLDAISNLSACGGTDYNQALIEPIAGGLAVSEKGKYKKVIVMISDGAPNFEPGAERIIKEANRQNCIIYAVTLGMPAPNCLKDITRGSGGESFENVTTLDEAIRIYNYLLMAAQEEVSCEITWQSAPSCRGSIVKTEFNLINYNLKNQTQYKLPINAIAALEFEPYYVKFKNPPMNSVQTQKVIVKAKNSAFNVGDISVSNPNYDISPKSFRLEPNETKELTVSYTALDSGYTYCKFDFQTEQCKQTFIAAGGWKVVKTNKSPLRLTSPNGGEKFCVGGDTTISWDGIPENYLVKLEYSADNGATWNYIDTARGLSYKWRNIPFPTSNNCLAKVSISDSSRKNIQTPELFWNRLYGGEFNDEASCIIEDRDKNYIVAGYTKSKDGDVELSFGNGDAFVLKLNSRNGDIIWRKTFGDEGEDQINSIIMDSDGNYIAVGCTMLDASKTYDKDFWAIKINSDDGDVIWSKSYGGNRYDVAYSVVEDNDGNYIVAGYSGSTDGDVVGSHGYDDCWLLKIKSVNGDIVWSKTIGGTESDQANCIIKCRDGGCIITGSTRSNDGDFSVNNGRRDCFALKIDPKDGSIVWIKTYDDSTSKYDMKAIESSNGDIVVTGYTIPINLTPSDYLVTVLNPKNGEIKWRRKYGALSDDEKATSIIESRDGNYIIAGNTNYNRGGYYDAWLIKVNSQSGSIIWSNIYGGNLSDNVNSIIEDSDGNYVLAGYSASFDGYFQNMHLGRDDYWVMKLSGDAEIIQPDVSDNVFSIVEPSICAQDLDVGESIVGAAKDTVVKNYILNNGSFPCRIKSIYFEGGDAASFSSPSGSSPFELKDGESKNIEIRFVPKRIGEHKSEIVIRTQSNTLRYKIRGVGVSGTLEVCASKLDFGELETGGSRTIADTVLIKNISNVPVTVNEVKHLGPDKRQFSIISGGEAFTLSPNETHKMTLKFEPKFGGRTSGRLGFYYNGVGSPAIAQLYGVGIGGVVRVQDDSARAGEKRNIILRLDKITSEGLASFAPKYSVTIRVAGSVLAPLSNAVYRTTADSTYVTATGDLGTTNVLASIPMQAALGLSSQTAIDIEDVHLLNADGSLYDYDFETKSGMFTLLDVCHEGGDRYLNPTGAAGIKDISPTPANDKIQIKTLGIESGFAKLTLMNSLGMKLAELTLDVSSGEQTSEIDVSSFSAGIYYIKYQSATTSDLKKFIICK
jgi:uncharacterized protein YegL